MAYCQDCRLSAVVDLKFGEDGAHMITDGTFREVKFPRDISVGKPVRDQTQKDFVGTVRKVAEMGYNSVEFAGTGGLSAAECKALLNELNLKAVGHLILLAYTPLMFISIYTIFILVLLRGFEPP